jgi:hydrogenase maturation protease
MRAGDAPSAGDGATTARVIGTTSTFFAVRDRADHMSEPVTLTQSPDSGRPRNIVVLGMGNSLRGDDGVGIHALHRLISQYHLAEHVRPIDGGVLGLELLAHLEGCDTLLVLDAIDAGEPPGTVVRLEGKSIPVAIRQKLSMHQAGLLDLLALLEINSAAPPRLVIWGAQPHTVDWSVDLSPAVASSLDRMVADIADELRQWGGLIEAPGPG